MIHIVDGRIGAGKTYYVVAWVLERYYEYSPKFFEYMPKKDNPVIFTNIRNLKLSGVKDIDRLIKDAGSLESFLSFDENGNLNYPDLKNSVIIIDEAQSPAWFPRKFYNPKIMYFFQIHRHYGIEIFLCTQDVKSLCPELRELPEYHVRAARQSLQLGGFRYQKFYDNEGGERSSLRRDKRIFEVYSSVEKKAEVKRPKSVIVRYALILSFGICLLFVSFYAFKSYFFSKESNRHKSARIRNELKLEDSSREKEQVSIIKEAEASEAIGPAPEQTQMQPLNTVCEVGSYVVYGPEGQVIKEERVRGKCGASLGS